MTTAPVLSHASDDYKEHDNEEGEKYYRTSHSGGLKATKTALSYIKKKGEGNITDELFRCYHDLAAKIRKECWNRDSFPISWKYDPFTYIKFMLTIISFISPPYYLTFTIIKCPSAPFRLDNQYNTVLQTATSKWL